MVITPKIRNNIFMNAHPVGCEKEVERQINFIKEKGAFKGPKNVLVIGSSTGYGLATRISAAFGAGAKTIGVAFEKEGSDKRTGTAGYYNTRAFDKFAEKEGLYSKSFNGDAFSHQMKADVINAIKEDLGQVDLVIYSLASGVRTDPDTGVTHRSVLKTIGQGFKAKSIDPINKLVKQAEIEPATQEEVDETIKVMGGEDWILWIKALKEAGVLAEGVITVAYSYVGPKITQAIYRSGTIGKAKEHLEASAKDIRSILENLKGEGYVSVNKALVTRASSVIPVVSLYTSLLYKVMKAKGLHEGCIEQINRLMLERLYTDGSVPVDETGLIRIDDWELRDDVQDEVNAIWDTVTEENLEQTTDLAGFTQEFMHLNGFDVPGVDYDADVDPR